MKASKEKLGKIVGGVAAVAVCGVTIFSISNHKTDATSDTASKLTLTAGVADVLNADEVTIPIFTSGVASVLNDFPDVSISNSNLSLVTMGMPEDGQTVADDAADGAVEDGQDQAGDAADAQNSTDAEAADTQEQTAESDNSICGYTNIGIANVETSNLNVREEPTTDSKIVGKMTHHNACEILEVTGDWSKIKSGSVSGYVKSEYLYTGEEALAVAREEVCTYATVTTETLRVRSEASTDSSIVSLVNNGEDLVVVEESDEWVLVEIDDETGYVYKDYVTIAQKLPTAKTITEIRYGEGVSDVRVDLVQYALQFVGNRYVWGGTSLTKGVDCSGFTMKIYEKYGIYLPHSSRAQPSYGTKIKASQAQPGDLFFYGSGKRISHVAIYIGNGQIVHASNKRDGIKISSAYYRTPICVARYLDD